MGSSVKKGPFVAPELIKLGEFAPTRTYKGHAGSKTSNNGK